MIKYILVIGALFCGSVAAQPLGEQSMAQFCQDGGCDSCTGNNRK